MKAQVRELAQFSNGISQFSEYKRGNAQVDGIFKGFWDRNGYKRYGNKDKTKVVRRHIHEEWNEIFRENRLSKEGKELYQKRKEHVERSFADSKQNHGYR